MGLTLLFLRILRTIVPEDRLVFMRNNLEMNVTDQQQCVNFVKVRRAERPN